MNKAELSYEQFLGTQEPCPALTPAATQLKLCEEEKKKKKTLHSGEGLHGDHVTVQ